MCHSVNGEMDGRASDLIDRLNRAFANTIPPDWPVKSAVDFPSELLVVEGLRWTDAPPGLFAENAHKIYLTSLDPEWCAYLFPAMLRDALHEASISDQSSLSELLVGLVCHDVSSMAYMLSEHMRLRNPITKDQQDVIQSVFEYLSSIGYIESVGECLEARFSERPHIAPDPYGEVS